MTEQNSHFNISLPLAALILVIGLLAGIVVNRFGYLYIDPYLDQVLPTQVKQILSKGSESSDASQPLIQKVVNEDSLTIDVVKKASPSVITVGIKKTQRVVTGNPFGSMFDPFGFFGSQQQQQPQVEEQNIEQDIGSGFVVSKDGLIVTNKHVVSDTDATYKIISTDNKEYKVEKIYRDPTLDLAILQTSATDIAPLPLGDSSKLQVGQFVIAIGTALGEFRNTVTTGVVSGLGRGITAGDGFGISTEQLDNVIQTDAAVNPGNSGGPLLNSAGQVIGVNVATSTNAENVSFAIPINVIKEAIDNFNQTGKFDRAFLGVKYKMISRDLAILNEIPEGAYLVEVVDGTPAAKAGLKQSDIITKMNGKSVNDTDGGLAKLISQMKSGEKVSVEYYRGDEKKTTTVTLGEADTQ
ncbi:PDZ domain-containing protein [Candidatus Beckwithbacteria bacterium]|nr:PDZ domain-containing protein [Candidatus Beckwithbacteria bacterium]